MYPVQAYPVQAYPPQAYPPGLPAVSAPPVEVFHGAGLGVALPMRRKAVHVIGRTGKIPIRGHAGEIVYGYDDDEEALVALLMHRFIN